MVSCESSANPPASAGGSRLAFPTVRAVCRSTWAYGAGTTAATHQTSKIHERTLLSELTRQPRDRSEYLSVRESNDRVPGGHSGNGRRRSPAWFVPNDQRPRSAPPLT